MVPETSPAMVLWDTAYVAAVHDDEATSSDSGPEEKEALSPPSNKFDAHVNATIKEGIQMRTSTQALASALRAQRLTTKKAKKKEAFKKTSVYQTLFPGII
jgi:hypothetical protein